MRRIEKSLLLLECHHSRPCYRLPFLKSFAMSWGKGKGWNWNQSRWKKRPNQKDKGDTYLRGYDGKKIDLTDSEDWQPSWSSAGAGEASLREENGKLKEAMRFVLSKVATPEEVPAEIVSLTQVDPRESLRQRQKDLNAERRAITKIMKTREQLDKTEERFSKWKKSITEGVTQEEKRHQEKVIDMRKKIQELQQEKSGGEPVTIESDTEAEGADGLKKDIKQVKLEFQQFATYTASMEQRNAAMIEQMQLQISSLVGCLQGSVMMGMPKQMSPEQNIRPRTMRETLLQERSDMTPAGGRDRSRSPTQSRDKPKEVAKDDRDYTDLEFKAELSKYPLICQGRILQVMNDAPGCYNSKADVLALMDGVMQDFLVQEVKEGSGVEMIAPTSEVKEEEGLPCKTSPALLPFGKAVENVKKKVGPYTPKTALRSRTHVTPDGSRVTNVDVMS